MILVLGFCGWWSSWDSVAFNSADNSAVSSESAWEVACETAWSTSGEVGTAQISTEIARYEATLKPFAPRVAGQARVSDTEQLGVETCSPSSGETEAVEKTTLPNMTAPPALETAPSADIWMVNTATASRTNPTPEQTEQILFQQWKHGNVWETRNGADFQESLRPGQPVLFCIHGNRSTANEALWQALQALRLLPATPQVRLVVFKWNADRVSHRLRTEYGTKAIYADYQGFHLARILAKMRPDAPVALLGHSFGARTALSALHLLGGGSYAGWSLDAEKKVPHGSVTVLLVAAATNNTDLVPNGRFSHALTEVKQIQVVQNDGDPALQFYPKMNAPAYLPEAMGKIGPSTYQLSDAERERIRRIPVQIPSHRWEVYLAEPNVAGAIRTLAF